MRGERKRERERERYRENRENEQKKRVRQGGHGGAGRGRNAISTYYQATQYVPSESAAHNEESRSLLPQMHSTEFLVAPPDAQFGTAAANGRSVVRTKSKKFIIKSKIEKQTTDNDNKMGAIFNIKNNYVAR
jgi:hypothetical protein